MESRKPRSNRESTREDRCRDYGHAQKIFNLVDPAFRDSYIADLKETIAACKKLNIQAIITQTGNERLEVSREIQHKAVVETLKRCTPLL